MKLDVLKFKENVAIDVDGTRIDFEYMEKNNVWSDRVVVRQPERIERTLSRVSYSAEEIDKLVESMQLTYDDDANMWYRICGDDAVVAVTGETGPLAEIWSRVLCMLHGTITVFGVAPDYLGFYNYKANKIDLSCLDTSKMTSMRNMFRGTEAEELVLDGMDTSNVTDMSGMFFRCNTKRLWLGSFDTRNVYDMSGMFEECRAEHIDVSSFCTENLVYARCMFANCKAIELDVSTFNFEYASNLEKFMYHASAKNIELGEFYTPSLITAYKIFSGCEAEYLDVGRLELEETEKSEDMFSFSKIKHLKCKNWRVAKLADKWSIPKIEVDDLWNAKRQL